MRPLRVGLVLAWVCAPSIAAAGKPSVWVLDLDGDGPAHGLSAQIRDQATTSSSPYALHREDDSTNACGTDAACLARVGGEHGVDFVIGGRLATTSEGFDAVVVVVETASRRVAQRWQAFIPGNQVGRIELRAWAATAYGVLTDGPGQPLPAAPRDSRREWKIATAIGVGSTAALALGFAYYLGKLQDTGPGFATDSNGGLILDSRSHPVQTGGYGGYCQRDAFGRLQPTSIDENGNMIVTPAACAHGTTYATMTKVTALAGLGAIGFTTYAAYRGFIRREPTPSRVMITPVVAPDAAGAMLRVDW